MKEIIISEYLAGKTSYRLLGLKHGVSPRTINHWVMMYLKKDKIKKEAYTHSKTKFKEDIVADYLAGDTSYNLLGKKYGVPSRTIHYWVMQHLKKNNGENFRPIRGTEVVDAVPHDVKELQSELRKARSLNEVLNQLINIAEEEFKIPIRKKYGTKRF